MERFRMADLLEWKKSPKRKPLILWGARQVGKTWLMKEFGKRYYENVVYASFFKNSKLATVFEGDFDLERILTYLKYETGISAVPGQTLIVLDEIQECGAAIESLKMFCETAGEYHVICAGSLLGISIHPGISFPVGKVDEMYLYPLNYREFLCATGHADLVEILSEKKYIPDYREKFISSLREYYYVGGMPEAVASFASDRDYLAVRKIQNMLISQYEEDFLKHVPHNLISKVRLVWDSVPVQLAKENKKFFFGQIKKGGRYTEFEDAINWLVKYGLVYKVNKVTKPGIPLKSYVQPSAFKLFLLDCGLVCAMSGVDAVSVIEGNEIFSEFKGALTEEYVLTQLISDTDYVPYYYGEEKGAYENDFLIQKGKSAAPVEVKAEENLKSKSLRAYHDKFKPDAAYRISMSDFKEQEWMTNVPLYAIHDYL